MTDRYKEFRAKILDGTEIVADDGLLEWITDEYVTKVGKQALNDLLQILRTAGYLLKNQEENAKTRQARRQYVYDCMRAGKVLELD